MKKLLLHFLAAFSLMMAACNDASKSNESRGREPALSPSNTKQERNKKVIVASIESLVTGNLDGTFKDAATGFVDYGDGSSQPVTDIESLKGFLKVLLTSLEGYKAENLVYFADGDHVMVYGDWGGTFKADMMGVKATGKMVKFKDVDIFKLNDEGKITEHRSVQNIGAVLMAAGPAK